MLGRFSFGSFDLFGLKRSSFKRARASFHIGSKISQMAFNVIDILLVLLLVLLSMLSGYRRGLILGVLDLASWILSLLAGLRFYQPVARRLAAYIHSFPQIWNRPIGFPSSMSV
jgi:uncharacterized protein YybS (DUF2232 family)